MSNPDTVTFLVVEDDDLDYKVLTRTFKKLNIDNPIIRAYDGMDALEKLTGKNNQEKITKPYIILLDINMPRMNGLELLHEIRNNEELSDSVVFILSTSNSDADVHAAYQNHIAGYILKTDPADGFMEAISMIGAFWRVIKLPR